MSRMHSGAKGRHGSTRPSSKVVPEWVEYTAQNAVELVVNLYNQGLTPSAIGTTLRDQYGIPSVKTLTKKRIEQILEENKLKSDVPRDLLNLIRRSVTLQKHLEANRKDFSAKRGYQLTVAKIRRLADYYKHRGKLGVDWNYTPEMAALLVK
ncbi:MAG: 30S ribosomal protein S15 [Candidatus Diapherotrites archaeon]|nr:30S ribosomal protein S15 [Candidatus Diapherotrites archaeon]